MIRFTALRAAQVAATLSLTLAAGCAAPVATAPAPTAAQPEAVAGAPAAAQPETAPAALPAPAAVAPTALTGVATFHGQPVVGYAITVLDGRTGAPVPVKADLAGATGLAVLDKNLVTDAQGRFSLQVVGLTAGQSLRIQAKQGDAVLETIVTSNLQSLGAKAYRSVLEVGGELSISEVTSAIARVARGVLYTTRLLSPEAAAPVLAKLAAKMATLTGQLETALKINPSLANGVVTGEGDDADAAVKTLVSNANALKDLTASIADMVADVAKSAGADAKADAQLKKDLAEVKFVGTVLKGSLKDDGFKLVNELNGNTLGADAKDLGDVTHQTTPKSSGSHDTGVVVNTVFELEDALANKATLISLGADINLDAKPLPPIHATYHVLMGGVQLYIPAGVTIDGRGHALYGRGLYLYGNRYTLRNAQVSAFTYAYGYDITKMAYRVQNVPDSAISLENVTFESYDDGDDTFFPTMLQMAEAGRFTLTGCHFTSPMEGAQCRFFGNEGMALTITGTTFEDNGYGLDLRGSALAGDLTITNDVFDGSDLAMNVGDETYPTLARMSKNTFKNLDTAISLFGVAVDPEAEMAFTAPVGGKPKNTFDESVDTHFNVINNVY